MKDCKNTSGEDVSFTSRISQSLTTHLKLSKWLPLRTRVSADLHITKSHRTLWNFDLSLSRTFVHAELLKKSAKLPLQI
ncbi:hypothetical protein HKD37_17G048618 [Glycine soja]